MFAFGSWQGIAGSQTGYHCKELPVPSGWNSLFPTWEPEVTISSNCRFPEVGTLGIQPGNHRLPLQGTAGSQRMELLVPNLGARGYHCKQLPVPRGWNSRFPTWEPQVTIARNCRSQEAGTLGSQLGNHGLPLQATVKMIWKHFRYNFMVLFNGPVQNAWFCLMDRYRNVCVWFMARNCRFPKVGTLCCQRGNHRLPLQGTASSQRMELLVPNLGTRGYHCKQLPVPRGWNSRFPTWEPQVTIARNFRFPEVGTLGSQPGNHGLPLQATVKMIWKHFRYNFMVLLNGPVQKFWFCLMDRYRNVCVWFMARNCRFPKVGTLCCQRGNHRLPLQGTAGSQRIELLVPNLGTRGYHCKQLPVPRGWNSLSPTWEPEVTIASKCRFPEVGTHASQPGNHGLPLQATVKMIWKHFRYNFMVLLNGPVQNAWFCLLDRYQNVCVWFMARNCRFPEVGTLGSQPGNHGLPLQATVKMIRKHFRYNFMVLLNGPVQNAFFAYWTGTGMFAFGSWQGTAGSQRLELSVANVGTTGYHCKELPVPRGWNSWFPTWEPEVTIASNCRFPEVGTHASQPGNHRLPLQGTAGPKRLELLVPNLGTMGYHCKQLLKWYENIFVTTLWFCLMDRYTTLGFA